MSSGKSGFTFDHILSCRADGRKAERLQHSHLIPDLSVRSPARSTFSTEPEAARTITTPFHDIAYIPGPYRTPNATLRNPVVLLAIWTENQMISLALVLDLMMRDVFEWLFPHELESVDGEDQEAREAGTGEGRGGSQRGKTEKMEG
ncbi:hypothetical protein PILCRDRAFT_13693 [Piloderma croceum F 1598]|uniref:Uncharacterized protein n=1 Tax=Piloderma croceum (strain F 1598) TaxID=765440 RepID=A0A0C3ERT1_PILCF|nr:hypothetical protein PILCRDRAFT_13693 [Piloderma croceum F 1598]